MLLASVSIFFSLLKNDIVKCPYAKPKEIRSLPYNMQSSNSKWIKTWNVR